MNWPAFYTLSEGWTALGLETGLLERIPSVYGKCWLEGPTFVLLGGIFRVSGPLVCIRCAFPGLSDDFGHNGYDTFLIWKVFEALQACWEPAYMDSVCSLRGFLNAQLHAVVPRPGRVARQKCLCAADEHEECWPT